MSKFNKVKSTNILQRYLNLSSKTSTEINFLLLLVVEMHPSKKYLIPSVLSADTEQF